MRRPILSYDDNKEHLLLDVTGWTEEQINAILQQLTLWHKVRKQDVLYAEPLALAYREIKQLIPGMDRDEASLLFFFAMISAKTKAVWELGTNQLYPVQVEPTQLLCQRKRAILTATPGLGKTIMACTALREHDSAKVVIIAPLSLLQTWREEIDIWLYPDHELEFPKRIVKVWRKHQQRDPGPFDVVITTVDVVEYLIATGQAEDTFGDLDFESSYLILDESFSYKNRKAQRSKAMQILSTYFGNCWMLSGMPVSRFNDDLFMQLKILYPRAFQSYWKFAARYCLIENTVWGSKIVGDKPGAERLLKKDLADILVECKFPEGIPDWEPEVVSCPLYDRQATIYLELREKLAVEADVLGRETKLTVNTMLTLTGRLLQAASNPILLGGVNESSKWDKLVERLKDDPLPALVWVQYIKTAELLEDRLKALGWLRVGVLTGKTKPAERSIVVKQFQDGELDVLIAHPGVGRYGHTLTSAKTCYYLEMNFFPEQHYQTLFRARRITSKHGVRLVYLLATFPGGKRTIDHVVHELLTERSENAMMLTVGELVGSL